MLKSLGVFMTDLFMVRLYLSAFVNFMYHIENYDLNRVIMTHTIDKMPSVIEVRFHNLCPFYCEHNIDTMECSTSYKYINMQHVQ